MLHFQLQKLDSQFNRSRNLLSTCQMLCAYGVMCGAFSLPVLNVFDQQGARLSRLLLITALKTEVYSEETSEGRPSFHTLGNLLSVNRVQVIYSLH